MQKMRILLIEDEKEHCIEYKDHIRTLGYHPELYIAHGEADGLKKFHLFPMDVVILDLELQESDGDGIIFLEKIRRLKAPENLFIIVITHNTSFKTKELVRKSGADYVFHKSKPDYCPQNVVAFARYQYLIYKNEKNECSEPAAVKTMEEEVRSEMDKIGMTDKLTGKRYAIDSITVTAKSNSTDINLEKEVYPAIAKKYSRKPGSVAKAIENAIKDVWYTADMEMLAEHYTIQIGPGKGAPTNKDFICYYAKKIKDAGKA
jgi:DNA-binding response OmpR family regulator